MQAHFRDRVLQLLNEQPGLTDREITNALLGANVHPSQTNQACHHLVSSGRLNRTTRQDGNLGNFPTGVPAQASPLLVEQSVDVSQMSEDEVKTHLKSWLEFAGWEVEVAWGKAREVDIIAKRTGSLWLIEAKGCGSRPAMRITYFNSMLGELLRRMSEEHAKYSIAMPNIFQFRSLWQRMPVLARKRAGISALFVDVNGAVDHVDFMD